MGVDDDEHVTIVGTSHFELSEVAFELDIALGEEELGVIFVKDTVRDAGVIDAAVDLDISTIVGLGEVRRETTVVGDWHFALDEGSRDIVSLELELVAESALDGGGEDCVESEEEEMVISCSGVGSLSISGGRSSFHSAEAGGHSVASQLVKLMMMVVIGNLYTITRLNITDCNIGGCGKIGTHGNK